MGQQAAMQRVYALVGLARQLHATFTAHVVNSRQLAHVLVVGGRGGVCGGTRQAEQVAGAAQQAAMQRVAALVGLVC